MGNLGLERVRLGLDDLRRGRTWVTRTVQDRRRVGSIARFSGTFRLTDATVLDAAGFWTRTAEKPGTI